VPQDDIVHPELTVWEAVRYSAMFRLPPDYSDDEIDRRVATTLSQLGLEGVKHLQIGKPEKKTLSGGQRKRVNIAMELVTDPVIMFLDEPTSGLAADDTAALVQLLAELARSTGKTIITTIHQPAKDEFEKFNLTLIMGQGGVPIFYGPTYPDAYRFFGSFLEREGKTNNVDNPRDMFDMLHRRESSLRSGNTTQLQARSAAAQQWHDEFFSGSNPTFQTMYSGRREVGAGSTAAPVPGRRPQTKGQFGQLFGRYFRIKRRDVGGTAIMLLQAPVIGVLLALVFGGQEDAIPYWCLGAIQDLGTRSGELKEVSADLLGSMQKMSDNTAAIFFVAVAAVWFGTSNAAREIVSERSIYLRERMVNLGLFNYVVSKFLLLSLMTVIQCTVLLAIVFFTLGFSGGLPAFGISLVTLIATAMNSVAIGLALSAVVASSEAAMALTPIALIPQVVLGGLMVPMTTNSMLEWPMMVMPARWGFQGIVAQERLAVASDPAWVIDLQRPDLNNVEHFIEAGRFMCAQAQIASTSLNGAWGFVHFERTWLPVGVLASMMGVILMVILVVLKRRDRI
jgi:ABC-type multidrug transport system ATPase subunit